MLEVVGDGAHEQASSIDWVEVWNKSPELQRLLDELEDIHSSASQALPLAAHESDEFAMPVTAQFYHVIKRDFQQYYRQPSYIMAKFALGIVCGLFIGFSFWMSDNSQQGFQNTLFSLFLLCTIFSTMVNQ